MLTIANATNTYNGLSTDTKPGSVRNGDTFIEMDTNKTYMYDEENAEWREILSGSGGGGSSSSNFIFLEKSVDEQTQADILTGYTAGEVWEAVNNGYMVCIRLNFHSIDHTIGFEYVNAITYLEQSGIYELLTTTTKFTADSSNDYFVTGDNPK